MFQLFVTICTLEHFYDLTSVENLTMNILLLVKSNHVGKLRIAAAFQFLVILIC